MPARTPPSTSPPDLCRPGLPSTAIVARWDAAATSLAVIFLDTSLLNDSTWLPSQPTLQPMALEDVQQMLSGALKSLEPPSGIEPSPSPTTLEPKPLTPRQCDILKEVACGRSNSEIAERLHISVETVKTHVRQLLVRMGARNRTELATIYQRTR
ncbi:MAG: helix-turn-helix transcriptional regulator [Ralstonia sp.]|uniref:helix-turn-helix transcriptional regulator n=1 Tax=Ralstonia sp. TaxID=54061 RepID=UPI003F7CE829